MDEFWQSLGITDTPESKKREAEGKPGKSKSPHAKSTPKPNTKKKKTR